MKNFGWMLLGILLLVTAGPKAFGADFDTVEGTSVELNKTEKSLEPLPEGKDGDKTKSHSLEASYTSGSRRGNLLARLHGCRISDRNDAYHVYHVEFTKRGQSNIRCWFNYRPSGEHRPPIRVRLYHKATIANRCPINITVNDTTRVYDWSPRRTRWHSTTWEIGGRRLRRGKNEIVIRLSSHAPKQYWLKRVRLSSDSNCLFRTDGSSPDPDDARWRRLLGEARKNFDDGRRFAREHNYERARKAFRICIRKCERVIDNARSSSLRERAKKLRRRAKYELRELAH